MYDTKPKYVAEFNGNVQCSLSYVNIQPAHIMVDKNEWVGCHLTVNEDSSQWKLNVTNTTDWLVECGFVCSCNTGPTTNYGSYDCIRPILPDNAPESLESSVPHVAVGWVLAVLGIVIVASVWLHYSRLPGLKGDQRQKKYLIV